MPQPHQRPTERPDRNARRTARPPARQSKEGGVLEPPNLPFSSAAFLMRCILRTRKHSRVFYWYLSPVLLRRGATPLPESHSALTVLADETFAQNETGIRHLMEAVGHLRMPTSRTHRKITVVAQPRLCPQTETVKFPVSLTPPPHKLTGTTSPHHYAPSPRAGLARTALRAQKTANAPVVTDSKPLNTTICAGLEPTK